MTMDEVKINQNLTPVKFPEVASVKSKTGDIVTRLEDILRTIHSNHMKWEAAHKRGLSLCTSIEAIKSRCLESKENHITNYPEELKPYCDKLATILTIFEDISNACIKFTKQIIALSKLNKNPNEIFFRTWRLENFLNFTKMLEQKYELELQVKRSITMQIAHSTTIFELMMHVTCWQYPEFINDNVNLLFTFFTLEINNLIKS